MLRVRSSQSCPSRGIVPSTPALPTATQPHNDNVKEYEAGCRLPVYYRYTDYGRDDRLAFLDEVDRGAYRLEPFGDADFTRARRLLDDYGVRPGFGIADAFNVVLAERYGTRDTLTTDQRDFRRVELPGGGHFRILPYD